MPGKGAWFMKVFQDAKELQLPGVEGAFQCREKQSSEQAGQNAHWQEEARPARHPSLRIRGEASAGHDTMQVRMEMQVLSPRMEYGEEADLCSQVLRVRGDGRQGFGHAAE